MQILHRLEATTIRDFNYPLVERARIIPELDCVKIYLIGNAAPDKRKDNHTEVSFEAGLEKNIKTKSLRLTAKAPFALPQTLIDLRQRVRARTQLVFG